MGFFKLNRLYIHKNLSADFSFDEVGAKEKSIKKKNATMGGAAPPPRKLLKKLDQNFSLFVSFLCNKKRASSARFRYS